MRFVQEEVVAVLVLFFQPPGNLFCHPLEEPQQPLPQSKLPVFRPSRSSRTGHNKLHG